ncbi:GDSL-type esterase/lipase family protein [Paenibacillus harenae]|uniref:Lysophospholipase L1-like esterase n=1 Tax=Paenibacillus harenae TaxID=306543 RepID=A0ABT9TVQ9_PAEHA|nr:GDSL-type esterase/lipase family protein [Paenibacillus harenae]MDQ0111454.1 lysophospholipase L1-like esterase [Paenibacillus harenae]
MSRSRLLWPLLAGLTAASTVCLLLGFGWAVKDMLYPAMAEVGPELATKPETDEALPLEEATEIRIVAFGDSLTKGTGDTTGEGYVKLAAAGLRDKLGKPVRIINNLAINGMLTRELSEKLELGSGYRQAIKGANLILFTIGGNDLFQSARAANQGRPLSALQIAGMASALTETMDGFEKVVQTIGSINPDATILYIGLYNPFYDVEQLRSGSLEVQQWNTNAYAILHKYPKMMMVPTFDLFEWQIGKRLSEDHFHPNHEGYKRIAERIVSALE